MRYLLDSNTLSDLYEPTAHGHSAILGKLSALEDEDRVFVSIVALYEAEYGFAKAPEAKKPILRRRISEMQVDFEVLPLTFAAARLFGELKARLSEIRKLSSKAEKMHNIDLMMAATAITEECILISADSIYPDLCRIDSNLRVESWVA